MSEWKEYGLNEIASFSQGKQIPVSEQFENKLLELDRFIRIVDFTSDWTQPPRYVKKDDKYKVGKNDIVMLRYGTPGKVFRGHEGIIANNMFKISPDESIVTKEYLYWFLYQDSVYKILMANQSSSTMPAISFKMLSCINVKVPSFETQQHISSFFDTLDEKIAVNKKICENLEAQAQALFKHWFVDFAPFKDGKFVESELGLIPEGLMYKRIEDMPHTLETGKRPTGGVKGIDSGIPSIGAENIKGLGCYDFSKTKYVTEEFASSMKKGIINGYELLIYKDGGKPGYFIPNFAIFGEGYPYDKMCLNEHVFKLDFGNKGYSLFAYFFFKTKQIMSYLNAQGAKAAIPGINSKDIDAIMMPSLDNECVKQYCSEVEDIITQILVLSKESSRLATLRDTLLPKLMSGQTKL